MKNFRSPLLALFLILYFSGCKKSNDVMPLSINPSDVNVLSKYITLAAGAKQNNGTLPAPENIFSITSLTSSVVSSNGSTVSIVVKFNANASPDIAGYYINIEGSDIYYKVPINEIPSNGILSIPVGLPSVLEAGKFCVNVMTYNSKGQTSNVVKQCIDVVKLGSGALQINLAWDTDDSDIDLHVIDPSGFEIYYRRKYSSVTGGQLDRDDVDGFGPENIYWLENAPDGVYKVYLHYYGDDRTYSGQNTKCYVTVNGPKGSKLFTNTLSRVDERIFVTRITKSGDQLTFSSNENGRMTDDFFTRTFPEKSK
jgi:hypothetical protein